MRGGNVNIAKQKKFAKRKRAELCPNCMYLEEVKQSSYEFNRNWFPILKEQKVYWCTKLLKRINVFRIQCSEFVSQQQTKLTEHFGEK